MQEEKIIQSKICKHCNNSFDITDKDLEFYDKVSPKFNGIKYQIPTPTICPDCRQRRRLSFRNERKLYRRKCDASGKDIISMYSPEKTCKVYDQKIRRSDDRDPMKYGRDFDFTKSFTEQFGELMREVPLPSMYSYFSENSEYSNCCNYEKNCYLTSASSENEFCMYSAYILNSKNVLDSYMCYSSDNSYKLIDCENCYKSYFCSNVKNSNNSYFLSNCNNCSFCFDCDDLENKKYCINNKQYSEEEYKKKVKNINFPATYSKWITIKQTNTISNSENCT